jgi:lipopolysaccharide export LptBFGC system permease protein LptF
MDISNLLQTLAVLVECAIAAIAFLIALQYRKLYGGLIAITFAFFVVFDIVRIFALPVSADINALIFLVACILMLGATWLLYSEK